MSNFSLHSIIFSLIPFSLFISRLLYLTCFLLQSSLMISFIVLHHLRLTDMLRTSDKERSDGRTFLYYASRIKMPRYTGCSISWVRSAFVRTLIRSHHQAFSFILVVAVAFSLFRLSLYALTVSFTSFTLHLSFYLISYCLSPTLSHSLSLSLSFSFSLYFSWLEAYVCDYRKRLVSLMGYSFSTLEAALAITLVDPDRYTRERECVCVKDRVCVCVREKENGCEK